MSYAQPLITYSPLTNQRHAMFGVHLCVHDADGEDSSTAEAMSALAPIWPASSSLVLVEFADRGRTEPPGGWQPPMATVLLADYARVNAAANAPVGDWSCLAWKRRPADKKVGLLSDLLKLIQLIDRDASTAEIEAVLKRDAGLSYKLVSMSNAASYGQATQVTSLAQAIGIVGRMQIKRWLTLMLVQAGGSDTPQVLLRVAFIRAAFLEELGKSLGPEIAKEDLFLCGAFSLVDTILGIPLPELLGRISISDAITDALVGGEGPLAPLLKVIEGIESKDDGLLRAQCELLSISPADVNRALITAISSAEEGK
jgi:hypothetical protein